MDGWTVKQANLNFRIGIKQIYGKSFKSLQLDEYLAYKPDLPKYLNIPTDIFTDEIKVIYLQSIPIEHRDINLNTKQSMIRYSMHEFVRHYIDLSGDFSGYLKNLSHNSRKNVTRKIKRFTEFCEGNVKWQEFTGQDIHEFYPLARDISKNTYQENILGEGLPETAEFQDNLKKLAAEDNVRGYLLFHNDRPIAYSYYQISNYILWSYYCGYEKEYSQWSPGTVLDILMIEKLFKDKKFKLLDQGEGDFAYKKALATHTLKYTDLMFLRNTMSNKALIKSHVLWNQCLRSGNAIADKLKLKEKLKKLQK